MAAVAQHGDAVGEVHHLLDAVGDVDDADALGGELADDAEEALAFGRGEGGGGLVHDEDAGVEREGLGDLDELLLAHAQAGDAGVGVEVDPEAGEERPRGGGDMARRSRKRPARSGSRPRKMLAATLSSGTRFSSWWMMATPGALGVADAGEARRARRRSGSRPSSAGWTPERIFISVDLPAPFSPMSAWTSPARRSKSTRSSAVTPAKRLLTPQGAQEIRVADVRRAGHASRTPPKVPPLPLAGESTIDKLGRQARAGQGSAIGAGNPNPVCDSVAARTG